MNIIFTVACRIFYMKKSLIENSALSTFGWNNFKKTIMQTLRFPFYIKLACALIILIGFGFLVIVGKTILLPLVFSFLFAILLLKPANFLENKLRFPRAVAAAVAVLLFIAVCAAVVYLLGSQISDLSQEWPALKSQLTDLFHNGQIWLQKAFRIKMSTQAEYIDTTTSKVLESGGTLIEQTVLSISSIILLLVFFLIYTFFILLYRRHLMRFVVAAFTEKYISIIYDITEQGRAALADAKTKVKELFGELIEGG